ncbi:unnamed protein product, partial [Mesorhabditis belari]|uniref:CHK kinase-like domain-containing protein n=1 Tax=Mesorhabditis belari TaxID=2138241 RepID=A0AAF3F4G1_9BILA
MPSTAEAFQNLTAAGSTEMNDEQEEMQKFMHNNETAVYTWLKSLPEKPIAFPKIYGSFDLSTETPMILMEEVKGDLMKVENGFTEEQLFSIAHELARFHAFCFTNDSWKNIEFYAMDFAKFDKFEAIMKQITAGLKATMPGFWTCLDPLFEKTTTRQNWELGLISEDNPHRIVAHGDLWSPQIIWRDGKIATILDWQVSHLGSLIEDISRVLATCTTTELRRKLQSRVFDSYYEKLTEELLKREHKVPFARGFLDDEFKRILPFTLTQTLFACAIWANSNVLKKGDSDDQKRQMEIFSRTRAFFDDSNKLLGWTNN